MFSSIDYIDRVTPSAYGCCVDKDEYVLLDKSQELLLQLAQPKRFSAVEAGNHSDGNQKELFRLIEEGLQWLNG